MIEQIPYEGKIKLLGHTGPMTLKLKYSDKSPDLTIRAVFKNNSNPKAKYGEPIVVKGNPKFIKC